MALWFGVGLVCLISIGVALGSVLPTSRSAAAVGNLVFVPAFLLGGGGPPLAVVTGAMGTIADVLPLSHVVGLVGGRPADSGGDTGDARRPVVEQGPTEAVFAGPTDPYTRALPASGPADPRPVRRPAAAGA